MLTLVALLILSVGLVTCLSTTPNPGDLISGVESIRLVGGANEREGRVEVLANGVWGTVCNDWFGTEEATVVCRSHGFQGKATVVDSGLFGYGTGAILLDNVACNGDERSLNECYGNPIGDHNCRHVEDVAIVCGERLIEGVRLVNGTFPHEGRLEVMMAGVWGTVCGDGFNTAAAQAACRSLGFPSENAGIFYYPYFGLAEGHILMDDVMCSDGAASLDECQAKYVSNCAHYEDVQLRCVGEPVIENIRLVNGTTPQEGRLEVMLGGVWGTVCDDGFDTTEAQAVCRSLGFPSENAQAFQLAHFGQGTGPILMDNVVCNATAASLSDCQVEYIHYCNPIEDVGVRCA